MNTNDAEADWNARLRAVRGLVVTLTRETRCLRLDDRDQPIWPHLELPAGTQVQYVQTGYDPMILDRAFHTVKVLSGPVAGTRVDLFDLVSSDTLPWEV